MENKFDIGDFVNVLTIEKVQCDLVDRVRERRKEMGFQNSIIKTIKLY